MKIILADQNSFLIWIIYSEILETKISIHIFQEKSDSVYLAVSRVFSVTQAVYGWISK